MLVPTTTSSTPTRPSAPGSGILRLQCVVTTLVGVSVLLVSNILPWESDMSHLAHVR